MIRSSGVVVSNIIRVFPRRTKATPDDDMVFIGEPQLFRPEADEVHISCTFTWDIPEAERLYNLWSQYYSDVKIGGPGYRALAGANEFTPGLYLKPGYVITSRGCRYNCKFCLVPIWEGKTRTLKIHDGYNVVDNNILSCPKQHIWDVFKMLDRQPQPAMFTGGLDIRLIDNWVIDRLIKMRLKIAYIAYDRKSQKPLINRVVKTILDRSGWSTGTARNKLGCYVLIGYDGDTINAAIERLEWIKELGIRPFPMFYQPPSHTRVKPLGKWADVVRNYSRSWILYRK